MTDNPFDSSKKIYIPNKPLVFYEDKTNDWRWHIKAKNGEIIGASSEGFASKQMALKNLNLVAKDIIAYYAREKDNTE